jgi:tetratricopeptide (TPR) repeat protein
MKTMHLKSCRASKPGMRDVLNNVVVLGGLLAALLANPAFADESVEVSNLVRAGEYAAALGKADSFLARHPRDAQMRFLKGVILTEQNKSAEAIALFTKLTEDFPTLPEPYNNLAVLYAAAGHYDKARAALDKAIHTNPAYATAYENLGDIHAKLASQAYDKALQLNTDNSDAKAKLTLVRSLVASTAGVSPKVTAAPNTSATIRPVPAASAPAAASADSKVAAAQPSSGVGLGVAFPAVTFPSVTFSAATNGSARPTNGSARPTNGSAPPTAKPSPATIAASAPVAPAPLPPVTDIEPKPAPRLAPGGNADRDAVLNAVNGWASAWSTKNVKGYLGFYANDFETPGGLSRKAWAEERRSRIAGKGRINIKVESPQVAVNGNTATVKFRQMYVSDRLKVSSRKTLVLTRHGSNWQIKQERTGS